MGSAETVTELTFFIAGTNQIDIIKKLLDHGAKADFRNVAKLTPLHIAIREGQEEMAETLIGTFESKSELFRKTNQLSKTVYDYARSIDLNTMAKHLEKFVDEVFS